MGERAIRRQLIILALLTPLLAGCPHKVVNEPLPAQPEGAQLPDGAGGIYKTGNPYRVNGRWYTPMPNAAHYDETGTASWYGSDFHGRKTANGERYDMHALSAAHKTLPLPTLVRVTNLENGRSVIVRVNDRGPFVKDRLIDLSRAAAAELGYLHTGTTRVRVQTLDSVESETVAAAQPPLAAPAPAIPAPAIPTPILPMPAPALSAPDISTSSPEDAETNVPTTKRGGHIYIQLASFGSEANAQRMRDTLVQGFPQTLLQPVQVADRTFYRVRIGPFEDMKAIEQTVIELQKQGYQKAIVIIE